MPKIVPLHIAVFIVRAFRPIDTNNPLFVARLTSSGDEGVDWIQVLPPTVDRDTDMAEVSGEGEQASPAIIQMLCFAS